MGGLRVAECDLGRLDKFWSKYLLEQNVIVTMSGSKFFRGPAHSEAILVPPQMMEKLIKADEVECILPKAKLGASFFP